MGMKYLKLYESFDEIEALCRHYKLKNYTINQDGSIDVNGDVVLTSNSLSELPFVFNKVYGLFNCSYNNLTSLKGSPKESYGFSCSFNKLTSLEFAPENVYGWFLCNSNYLTSLKGCPKSIESIYCHANHLTSLEGCPSHINGDFYCFYNDKLSDINGLERVDGKFVCHDTLIFSVSKLFPDTNSFMYSLDYNYFRPNNKINKIRLSQALKEFGLECPNRIKGYELI